MRTSLVVSALLVVSAIADEDVRHLGPVTAIATSGDNVYSCSQAGILRSNASTGKLSTVVSPDFRVTGIAAVGDQQLAICGGRPGESGVVGIAKLPSGELATRKVGDDLIYAVAVSPSRKSLAAACADGTILLFGLPFDSVKQPAVVHKHTATARAVAFSPDGSTLVSGGLDGVILISAINDSGSIDGKPRALQEHTAGVECLALSPDGKYFASGSRDSKLRLHSIEGRLIRTYSGIGMENEPAVERVPARVWALAWHKENLIAGTSKGTLYRMSLTDDTWSQLEHEVAKPIYTLAYDQEGSLWIGSESLLVR